VTSIKAFIRLECLFLTIARSFHQGSLILRLPNTLLGFCCSTRTYALSQIFVLRYGAISAAGLLVQENFVKLNPDAWLAQLEHCAD